MSSRRKGTKFALPVVKQSAKAPVKAAIDESRTAVSTANANIPPSSVPTIELSSDSSSNYDDISDEEADSDDELAQKANGIQKSVKTSAKEGKSREKNGADDDVVMRSPDQAEGSDDDAANAPTFGDLLGSQEVVDVSTALAPHQQVPTDTLVPSRSLAPPSLSSLGTVLTQALRTDDTELLESCLRTLDLKVIQNTIQRMDSSLAATLLNKLAARLHRRPGRAHSLMVWVQTTLIAHGGSLSLQADVVNRLGELKRVLDERSRGLNSLLMLKGKLDMLEAQMQIRRENRTRGSAAGRDELDSEDEEEGIIYVEGEEDALANGVSRKGGDDDGGVQMVNGVADSDDSDDSEEDDDDEDMDEPEEDEDASPDEDDEDEVDINDVDEMDEEEASEPEVSAPPPKLRKTSKAFAKKR